MPRLEDRKVRALERIADRLDAILDRLGVGEQPTGDQKTSYEGPVTVRTPAARPVTLNDDPEVRPMTEDSQ